MTIRLITTLVMSVMLYGSACDGHDQSLLLAQLQIESDVESSESRLVATNARRYLQGKMASGSALSRPKRTLSSRT